MFIKVRQWIILYVNKIYVNNITINFAIKRYLIQQGV